MPRHTHRCFCSVIHTSDIISEMCIANEKNLSGGAPLCHAYEIHEVHAHEPSLRRAADARNADFIEGCNIDMKDGVRNMTYQEGRKADARSATSNTQKNGAFSPKRVSNYVLIWRRRKCTPSVIGIWN